MTADELREKIKDGVRKVYVDNAKIDRDAEEYDELTKFPQLKAAIVDLLTVQFSDFLDTIDWVAPRPSTFRINLINGQNFMLIYTDRSWIAKVEGKKYYMVNLDEEERAAQSVARILSYGEVSEGDGEGGSSGGSDSDFGGGDDDTDTDEA